MVELPVVAGPVRYAIARQDEAPLGRPKRRALLVHTRLRASQILRRSGGAVVVGPQESSLAEVTWQTAATRTAAIMPPTYTFLGSCLW